MDVAQKKQEVLESIASQPLNVVYIRVDVCDQVQLADLLKEDFVSYLRGPANSGLRPSDSVQANTDSLHEVCINLAKQRALLQGASVGDVLNFKIDDGTAATRADGTATHNTTGSLSFGKLEDSDYSNRSTFGYTVLHDLNETGGSVTLSSTSNANTTIVNDDGENVKYFTDFSKYFLTRSRANGELISVDGNTSPYISPTAAEPFIPANTVNGETFAGTVPNPSANTDVRHEFSLTANTTAVGYVGANNDITENKYVGNTFVTIEMSDVIGSFQSGESIKDFDENSATVKSYANTSTILLNGFSGKGTLTIGETLTDSSTNATVESTTTVSETETIVTLTGSTFLTGSNVDISLGFSLSNTVALDTDSVSRVGTKVTITSEKHDISPGTRIALTGADDAYNEFNNTFVVEDTTENTLVFSTANTGTTIPTGDINMITNIVHGITSNATVAIQRRTTNASANVVFQSSNLSAGFPIGNNVTGGTLSGTGTIITRTLGGSWYQTKTNEVKTFYTTSTSGTWDYDATNNPAGIESTANASLFWNKEFEPVKINQLVASTGSGGTFVAPKVVLDIALATSSDTTGGFDASVPTKVPGIYLAYPLKTWEDQTHDGTVTLEAYQNFANVIVAPEGLEIDFDWKPLANSSGIAVNTTHITASGEPGSGLSAYDPEECTVLNESEFNTHLGPYNGIATANSTGGFPNAQSDDILLSSIPSNRSRAIKVGTSGAVYPSANANPFYPAVGGTHKAIANTSDDITGTQPGSLTANDIYAGSYTEIQSGAIKPPASSNTALHPAQDYRYIIQNDLKWVYATSPFAAPVDAATSSGQGQVYNTPHTAAYTATYDGYSKASTGFGVLIDSVEAQSGGGYSTTATIPQNSVGSVNSTPPTLVTYNLASGTGSITANSSIYAYNQRSTAFTWRTTTTNGDTGFDMIVTTNTTTDTVAGSTTEVYLSGTGGTTGLKYAVTRSPDGADTIPYLVNRVGAMMKKANTVTFHTMLASLQTGNDATYGAGYRDPNEPSSPNLKTDATFDADVNTMSGLLTSANNYHQTITSGVSRIANSTFTSSSHTYDTTTYSAWLAGIAAFQTDMTERISEITARIGYLNGKNVADGGSVDGSGTAGSGFVGTSFNGGNGYANTIYSHANFLAGKKINLVAKILKAVEGVTDIYTQIKAKRAEYYEFNQ